MAGAGMRRAAQYLRMSAEHQRYSLESQARAIAAYAQACDLDVVKSYVDAGVSGLEFETRGGLKQLLADIVGGTAGFEVVLVLDVSRWGRFQDPDEAAHYEFLCRSCGVHVTYCAEAFGDEASLAASVMKQIKRAMAAEYLRELSAKVIRAQRGVALQGYWRGGAAPYGFRRQMVRFDGKSGAVMEAGERKALHGHRSKLVRGPEVEVATVRRIFADYATRRLKATDIAHRLNAEGVTGPGGRTWAPWGVRALIANEAYIGTLVLNRRRARLRKSQPQPKEAWTRVQDACPALVSKALFSRAQARRAEYHSGRGVSDEALIEELRTVIQRHGRLDMELIASTPGVHSVHVIRRRFGSLTAAYELAGWRLSYRQRTSRARVKAPGEKRSWRSSAMSDAELIARLKALLAREGRLTSHLIHEDPDLPSPTTCLARLGGAAQLYALVGYAPAGRQKTILQAWTRRRATSSAKHGAPGRSVQPAVTSPTARR